MGSAARCRGDSSTLRPLRWGVVVRTQRPLARGQRSLDPASGPDVASGPNHRWAAMSTEQRQPVRAGTPIDDYDAIAATVQLYIEGSARGDAAKLSEGFHPDAQMYGAVGDDRYDEPIANTSSSWLTRRAARRSGRGSPRSCRPAMQPAQPWSRTDSGARCPSSPSSRCRASKAGGASSTRISPTQAGRCPQRNNRQSTPSPRSLRSYCARANKENSPLPAHRVSRSRFGGKPARSPGIPLSPGRCCDRVGRGSSASAL
jgi:putative lumazine-binding protein